MKEAGIEISVRQSFLTDPAVAVKNLKVPILLTHSRQLGTNQPGQSGLVTTESSCMLGSILPITCPECGVIQHHAASV